MLQKISIHYKPKDITLEDMIEKLKFLGKLKIPFVLLVGVQFVIIYVTQIIGAIPGQNAVAMLNALFVVVIVYYVVISVGFLIYRKRLVSLMPFELTKKVRRVQISLEFHWHFSLLLVSLH